jgi:flagellar biosynthesis/type III secretory pathway protein FliH
MADMSKTNALFGEPQAGQPANASAGEPVQQAAQQPDLSTLINKAIAENVPQVVNQALEAFSRKQQSQRDQQEARIAKKFQETLENIRASGIEPTQDQANAIRQKVARNRRNLRNPRQASHRTAEQPRIWARYMRYAMQSMNLSV